VEKTLIFDKEKFIRFVSNKQFLPDSYTAFKNKIGMTSGDEYVSETKMSCWSGHTKIAFWKEEWIRRTKTRRDFLQRDAAVPDDINRLLDSKVFTNFKRFAKTANTNRTASNATMSAISKTISLLKGNNLLALASLKAEFAGKVKLIYIDPPYNTGNDGFKYNDSFNHSSWLTFMKNRLEVAKQLLSQDGSIFIQVDDNEQAYLKILCDGILEEKIFEHK